MFKHFWKKIFILATIVLIGFSLAGYLGEVNEYLELTSHFKVQYLILSVIAFFFFIFKRYKVCIILSLFCLLINLVEVVPWYFPRSPANATSEGANIEVLLSNINKYGPQNRYKRVMELVRREKPDVVVLLEVGETGVKELEALQKQFPYSFNHQDAPVDGTAIYSKLPLQNPTARSLGGGRKAVIAELQTHLGAVLLVAVHPSNAIGKAFVEERNRQLKATANYIKNLDRSIILAGDLNTTMWSLYYQNSLGSTQLVNTRSGFGILPTWKIIHQFFAIPIDHLLVTPDIQTASLRTGSSIGSDRLPLIADLRISPANKR